VGDHMNDKRRAQTILWSCGFLSLLLIAGCDKLPWNAKSRGESHASSGLTTAQSSPAPSKPQVLPGDVLATVNGAVVSKKDLELRLQELKTLAESADQAGTPLTREQLEQVLEELINTELMSQDAAARGLDRSLDVAQRWEYVRRGFFAQEWLRWHQEHLSVAPEEVDKYYEDNKAGFRVPSRLRLRQIVVALEEQANRALSQLHGGTTDFANLAQQISLGPTAAKGGELPFWLMRANEKAFLYGSETDAQADGVMSLDPSLEAAAFAIDKVNGLSSYVKGADSQYHIFQLVERQEEHQREKQAVWDDVKSFLSLQKLREAIDTLQGKTTVERFTDRLEHVTQ